MTRRCLPAVFLVASAFASPAPAHAIAPSVTTGGASISGGSAAILIGSASPGGETTTAWFRYATVSPGTCNDTFGTRAPSSGGAALGDGTSAEMFTESLAGLAPGTRYYFCAIASNATGTAYGSVVSFTTPLPPAVTTSPAQSIGSTSATLRATVNPGGANTTGWFRWATANPGACDDTFGARAPASDGQSFSGGSSTASLSQGIYGLTQGTTYYYCAIATNSEGTSYGAVLSFTTSQPPIVATAPATPVTGTGATLNGSADPAGLATTAWFRYGTVDPRTCDDTFGTRTPSTGGTSIAAGSEPLEFSNAVTGLVPATRYYYCAIARNVLGTSFGAVQSFSTPTTAPLVVTAGTSAATGRGATLHASVNPAGESATGWFRYAAVSPGACNDTFGTRAPSSGGAALGAGTSAQALSQSITGLSPGTTYYYCALSSNSVGATYGAVVSFTTPMAPGAATSPATSITGIGATLQGTVNPNRASTTGWFRYATVNPGTCDDSFGARAPDAGSERTFGAGAGISYHTQSISGLTPGTTYYYCAIASNAEGTSFGEVLSFTTLLPPAVATSAATLLTASSATLNGSANPGGTAATGWFRLGTSSPGACDDAFGTRAPSSGGTTLGAGTAPVDFARAVTGLAPATTYYYCAIAEGLGGKAFGAVQSFTTRASAPTVSNGGISSVTATGATLHATANPGGASTTGWFRYGTVSPGVCSDTFGTRAPSSDGSALGASMGAQAFSHTVSGLSPGTTYYYCPIVSSSEGTAFGWVASFTTPAAPAVTTSPATSIAGTSAGLVGAANPNGASTTGWFRYDTANPGACDDTFGTRAPSSYDYQLGSGSTPVAFSIMATGLAPATTYYYCAIAENAVGKQFGALVQFTTRAAAPTVTTAAPTEVTRDSAVLNGAAIPGGAETTGWFRWSASHPMDCNDTFGTRTPAVRGSALGAGAAPVSFSSAISGLTRGTTYFYCAIAQNSEGMTFGALERFVPGSAAPIVATNEAAGVGGEVATLSGTANPNGRSATGWFRLGDSSPAACDDTFGTRVPASGGVELGAGTAAVAFEESLSSLEPNQTYWYCAAAASVGGATFGDVRVFTTAPVPPQLTTLAAVVGAEGTVTLEGLANPRGIFTTTWFRVGEADPGVCDDTFGTRWPADGGTAVGAGRGAVAFAQDVTGLAPGQYYACALGSNPAGTGAGAVVSFEIPRPSRGRGSGGCGTGAPGQLAAVALGLLALLGRRRR